MGFQIRGIVIPIELLFFKMVCWEVFLLPSNVDPA